MKHPSIQDSFFLKVEAPTNLDDAVIKMSCHQHAVNDFDLQLNINDLEIGMLTDHTSSKEVFPTKFANEVDNFDNALLTSPIAEIDVVLVSILL